MNILLDRQEQLIRIDRFDQVIGDLVTDSLVHDAFFFALGNHDDRDIGIDRLDLCQCFQSGQPRHILVQENNVERLFLTAFDGVLPADYRNHFISLILQEKDVGL